MIKLDKKKIIIFGSLFVVLLAVVLLFIFLGKNNKNINTNETIKEVAGLKYKEGYAFDTKEDITEDIYQTYKKSDVTYKMYGEVGWKNFNCMKETDKSHIYIRQECEYNRLGELGECPSERSSSGNLSSEPYVVKNHFTVSLTGYMDSKGSYHMDGAVDDMGTFWLTAYAELPEGTLISISSVGNPKFQVNIYDKETRVVMSDDFGTAMYFRVPDLKGRILTVQLGNKIIKTTGNAEFFVYSRANYFIPYKDEDKKVVMSFFNSIGADKVIKNKNQGEESYYNIGNHLGEFMPINGKATMLTRGTTKEVKISNEYRFMYYRKNYNNPKEYTYEYLSIGKEFNEYDISSSTKEYYGFLKDQRNLNKTNYGFNNIVSKRSDSIGNIMKKYVPSFLEYSLNIIRDYNSQRASNSVCGSDFLDALDNCGCKDGWYHIKGIGCCPNGYTYSTSSKKCIKTVVTTTRTCPSGTYYVGNDKCCKAGTTLSSDGLSCTSSSGSKSMPTYYPDSNGGATKKTPSNATTGSSSSCKPTTSCGAKDVSNCATLGMYEKNGQCCMNLVCVE